MGNTMKELPEVLRPYEKGLKWGAGSLDDAELLAVILRSGTREKNALELSREILEKAGGTLSHLYHFSKAELLKMDGIGEVRSLQIETLFVLAERIWKCEKGIKKDFSNPRAIADYYMETLGNEKAEKLQAVFLDTKCKLIFEKTMTIGSVNQTMIPVREILMEGLNRNAVYMVIVHNHPSGDPSPSSDDLDATKRLQDAASLIGIPLQDHIIIGNHRFVSLREIGYLK